MDVGLGSDREMRRRHRRLTVAIKQSLRDVRSGLLLLNHRVGHRLKLRSVDLDCLDIINMYGPLSPGELAARTKLHPATMTGILDRLERGGWVSRDRGATDRRSVVVRAVRSRNPELLGLFAGMNSSMDSICANYSDAELESILDFLRRTADAGTRAAKELAEEAKDGA